MYRASEYALVHGSACAELVPSYRCSQVGIIMSCMVSELRPLLSQNSALVLRRAPKRADPDQPTALSTVWPLAVLEAVILMPVLVS